MLDQKLIITATLTIYLPLAVLWNAPVNHLEAGLMKQLNVVSVVFGFEYIYVD